MISEIRLLNFKRYSLKIFAGGVKMADYRMLYTLLFNRITDALRVLDKGDAEMAAVILKDAQMKAEDMYINDTPEE